MSTVVVLSVLFARGAFGKIGGANEHTMGAKAVNGIEIEVVSRASGISELTIETHHSVIGSGVLGDLNANGVNQYLIENEASIERVDLDTVKTEFLDIYYAPSYTLDEPKAKDYEWYDTAIDLRGKINMIAKIRAKLSKIEKRLRKTTSIVVSKNNLQRNENTKELASEPNAALKDKFTGLDEAAKKFKEFAKDGYQMGERDLFDVDTTPSLMQQGPDELKKTIKSAEKLVVGIATTAQRKTAISANGAKTNFHDAVFSVCSKLEETSKTAMVGPIGAWSGDELGKDFSETWFFTLLLGMSRS